MAEEGKTYQPKWEKYKEYQNSKRHHHHQHYHQSDKYTNSWGGWMKMKDKHAYYGLMFIVVVALAFGTYKLVRMFVNEIRALPMDDPTTELKVDELRIHKVDEQEAILVGDSLAQTYHLDSIRRTVQIETRPVYRPPKRENTWYITKREWKSIWRNYKVWQWEKKREREEDDIRRKENSSRDSE